MNAFEDPSMKPIDDNEAIEVIRSICVRANELVQLAHAIGNMYTHPFNLLTTDGVTVNNAHLYIDALGDLYDYLNNIVETG